MNQIEDQQFFNQKYARTLLSDLTKVVKKPRSNSQLNWDGCIEFVCYGWNGINIQVYEQKDKEQIVQNQHYCMKRVVQSDQSASFIAQNVIVDILLINNNRYSVLAAADGAILLYKNGLYIVSDPIVIRQPSPNNNYESAYVQIAYFSHESQSNPSENIYYILAVKYSSGVSIFKSNSLDSFFQQVSPYPISQQFCQYDEINQILLILDNSFTITSFKISDQNHQLELTQIKIDIENLQKLGIERSDQVLGFDFQYKNGTFNIFILGNYLGIFNYNMRNDDDQNNEAVLGFLFNPFNIEGIQNQKEIRIFCDKRANKFDQQEVTIIYERQIIKFRFSDDNIKEVCNLNTLKNTECAEYSLIISNPSNRFQKYFCVYGNNETQSFHFLTYSNANNIEESIKIIPKLFVYKEL